jgi:hypothetical protein
VLALAAGDDGSMWVRTAAGVSRLRYVPMSLAEKAAHVEQVIDARHGRHGLVADSRLAEPGNLGTSHQYPNDNDGLWTAIYAAAQTYRYAVTQEEEARARATAALAALVRLESITGHDGFPARSFRHKDEPRHADGEWHWTPDGTWEWKGDTSSDELVGHFYAYALAHDLLPDSPIGRSRRCGRPSCSRTCASRRTSPARRGSTRSTGVSSTSTGFTIGCRRTWPTGSS